MPTLFHWVWWCLVVTVSASSSSIGEEGSRLLTSFFGYPDKCIFQGTVHACTFSFACWLVGGRLERGCTSGDLVAELMFTCCIPAAIYSYSPIRRGDSEIAYHKEPANMEGVRTQTIHLASVDYNMPELAQECGMPSVSFQKRIIGGNEAHFGELPWQAHIRINGYQCGGVLISRHFVATAAHCIHRARLQDIVVYLGEYDTQNTGQYLEPLPEEVHRVIQKIIHPNFQYRLSQPDRFDVALVKLSQAVIYRENILPICLPRREATFKGRTGVVAGWGKTDTTYGKTGTNILHKAMVPILSDKECLKWHNKKRINVELHREMFCAGHSDGHMDACLGDSGGPLVVYDTESQRWTLAGITSAGFGCAVDHQPGIYHNIAFTSDWIASHIHVIEKPSSFN